MTASGQTDFDFFFGTWQVAHRRLVDRLAGSDDWRDFDGTCTTIPILGGRGNMDDNLLNLPDGAYRAVTLRAFDPSSGLWSIWWLDGRNPHVLDVPVTGSFENGTGTFFAKDTFKGRAILVRFTWTPGDGGRPVWEQAFSPDAGTTWEPNWTMTFRRAA
jgi:hypothetical protein